MGVIVKTVPQLNVLVVGFPVKIAVGLVTLGLSLVFFKDATMGLLDGLDDQLSRVLDGRPLTGNHPPRFGRALREEVNRCRRHRWRKDREATGRRREQARNKGQMAKSQEVSGAVLLLVGIVVLVASGGHFAGSWAATGLPARPVPPAGAGRAGGFRELLSANLGVLWPRWNPCWRPC